MSKLLGIFECECCRLIFLSSFSECSAVPQASSADDAENHFGVLLHQVVEEGASSCSM